MNKAIAGGVLVAALASLPAWGAPTEITACGTITEQGSYVVAANLFTLGNCLMITTSFVTIDLAGFNVTGARGVGISGDALIGIAVRNGTITGDIGPGVDLFGAEGSIVEGLRITVERGSTGIRAKGIVRGNTVIGSTVLNLPGEVGIDASGVITNNT
jgi:hypothetical protein